VEPIAVAFGTALVAAMATDTWEQAREAVGSLWRRVRSRRGSGVRDELGELRQQVLAARRDGQASAEQALAGAWQVWCQDLLRDDPGAAAELLRVLGEVLIPMLAPVDRARVGQLIMTGSSQGSGTFNQVAGSQYNVWR
jgi:hypothetical protein